MNFILNLFNKDAAAGSSEKLNLDVININSDGVVSLNLHNKEVKAKIFSEINKLQDFDNKISTAI